MKKSQLERLEFLEKKLFWFGRVQRKEIQEQFEISPRVSTNDFAKYHELAPGNAIWDRPSYGYIAAEKFKPKLIEPDSVAILREVILKSGHMSKGIAIAALEVPSRKIPVKILRALLNAIYNKRSITICYLSMNRPEPTWREIVPHAFANDGFRWHVRAFCTKRDKFLDFVLGRIADVGDFGLSSIDPENDLEWAETVNVKIGPDPRLDQNQRAAIEMDYGMVDGQTAFKVRKSMIFYALKQLCLHRDTGARAREQQIILLNKEDLEGYLPRY